jgi:hypothetical protein
LTGSVTVLQMIEILLTKLGVVEYGYDWQTFILAQTSSLQYGHRHEA